MQIELKLSSGDLLRSDPVSLETLADEPEVLAQGGVEVTLDGMRGLFKDFRSMDGLQLIVGGETLYVNPAHIMWVNLVVES